LSYLLAEAGHKKKSLCSLTFYWQDSGYHCPGIWILANNLLDLHIVRLNCGGAQMGALIVAVGPFVWAVVFFALLIIAILALFSDNYKWAAAVSGVLALVGLGGWIYSSTHAVIPVNQVAVVVNTISQQYDGETRPSGLIDIPLWSARVVTFPAHTSYKPCEQERPGVKGGIAVALNVCYLSDASKINWKLQMIRQGKEDHEQMFAVWKLDRSNAISAVLGSVPVSRLESDLDKVGKEIFEKMAPVFAKEGYPLYGVVIQHWDYENKTAGERIDNETAGARAEVEKAKLEREAALLRADTANAVLEKQTEGLQKVFNTLGIVDSQSRAQLLQLRLLIDFLIGHPGSTVIVTTGGGSAAEAMLAQPKPAQPTPPATKQ
jgi:hypothetical protein